MVMVMDDGDHDDRYDGDEMMVMGVMKMLYVYFSCSFFSLMMIVVMMIVVMVVVVMIVVMMGGEEVIMMVY